jgi:hypothetical protein
MCGLCAGFLAVRSTPAAVALFTVDEARLADRSWDDQRYLNNVLTSAAPPLRHRVLPLTLFPNGQHWRQHHARLAREAPGPLLVHFNWYVGAEKREAMERHGRWYVGGEYDRGGPDAELR